MSSTSLGQDQAKFGSKNALNRRVTAIQVIDICHMQCFVGVYNHISGSWPHPISLTLQDMDECSMSCIWKNGNKNRQPILEMQVKEQDYIYSKLDIPRQTDTPP